MLQFLKKANATCAGATLSQIGHRLNYGREWHTISSQKPQTAMGSHSPPGVNIFDWGATAAGKPNKKQKKPQKQQQETSALEFRGVQAAETTTPMRASARDGRARTRSRARAANDVDETTSY